jgi:hypothetical protein
MPNSDRLLIEIPSAARMLKVPTSETGIATTGIIVAALIALAVDLGQSGLDAGD